MYVNSEHPFDFALNVFPHLGHCITQFVFLAVNTVVGITSEQ